MTSIRIIQGDSERGLKRLPDGSVHEIVTSPPYDDQRTYDNADAKGKPVWNFQEIAKELYRVLCPGGVLCWNVNDAVHDGSETLTSFKQAIYFVESVGFKLHDTMIYQRKGFSKPESVRYHQSFEYVFILSKGAPRLFNPIKDKKNVTAGQGTLGDWSLRLKDGTLLKKPSGRISGEYGMRTNIWEGNTRSQEAPCSDLSHPAMMPTWLARDLIISWSNPGEVVLDPFAGSGTTAKEARDLGRDSVALEISPSYIADMKKYLSLDQQLETGAIDYSFEIVDESVTALAIIQSPIQIAPIAPNNP